MRSLTALLLVASSAVLAAQAAPPPSQETPQRAPGVDRASATAVVIDVVVRDGRGRPVVDLHADDFEIYEDGVRQPIGSFRPPIAASTPAAPEPAASIPVAPAAAPAAATVDRPTRREPAVMAFLFDRLTLESRKLALDAVRKYVGTQATMSNIIGVFDVDLGLQILLPFTQDGEAIRTALAKVTATRPGRVDPMHTTDMRSLTELGLIGNASGTSDDLTIANQGLKDYNFSVPGAGGVLVSSSPAGIVTQTYAELQRNSATTVSVSGLTAVVAGLSRAPGRKSLVLFTEGVAISRNTDPYFYALIDQANRANVAIYTVDSVGLRAEDPILMAGRQVHSQTREDDGNLSTRGFDLGDAARAMPDVGLTILADQTGGQMFNASNDLFKAFPRLDEDLRSYYAVTYAAPRAEPDRRFHKIDVKVKRPGLSAKTRSGYTSLPAATGSMPVLAYEAPALARLDSTPLPNELPIMARALVFPVTPEAANVPVLVSVPANVLDYTRDDAAGTFAAEAVVLTRIRDDRGQVVHKASEQYTLNGKVEGLEASRAGELLFYRQPQLAPGVYTFEAIVMDTHSGKASVRISSLEVARTTGNTLRVGTPFIVRRAEPASASAADAGNPLYFGDVLLYPNLGQPLSKDTDKELAFGFTAYDGHGESIEGSLEILRSGQPLASVALALGAPDKHGRINQISRLPLEALAPGSYELRVILTSGQQRVTRSVRFALVGS